MIPDNITPAVNLSDVVPNEMSAEEFQRRLYGWFEDRGLLSELRAHLRKQMIGALKESSIGHTIAQHKQIISPKTQALNLLVGEFLLHYDYHYSLSVFSTEVPLTNVLPEVPIPLKSSQGKGTCKEWKFSEKDMWDILETVGVARESEIGEKIHTAYYKGDQQPLLACLIKFPNQILGSVNANIEVLLSLNNYDEWIKAIAEILHSNQVNSQQIKNVLKTIVTIVDNVKKNIGQECANLQAKLQQYENLKQEQTTQFNRTQKQIEVEDYQVKLLHHQNLLQERYHQLIIKEREVQLREHRLNERERQLEFREEQLLQKLNEVKGTGTNEHNELVVRLQTENKTLQTIKEEQCRKIEELTERSTILMRDLESTQAAVNILANNKSTPLLSPLHSNKPSVKKKSKSSLSSSTSEECTCSSNVLQEARERLKRLEEESEKVDRHYRQFKLQRSQDGLFSYGTNRSGGALLNKNSALPSYAVSMGHSDLEKDKWYYGLQELDSPCKDADLKALDNSLSISISSDDKTN